MARLGEESIDKATLLETAQSDKETISRSALKLLGPLHLPFYRQKWPKSKLDKISKFCFIQCKEIQDRLGFWIPRRGFRIPVFLIERQWNLDSGF